MSSALSTLALVASVILLMGLVLVRMQASQRRRPASAIPHFLRHFEAEGLPVDVAMTVFHQLQHWMEGQDRRYPVKHDQDLERVYGLVSEEIEAALARMAGECGRRFEPSVLEPRPENVADLVRALARCPEA